MRASTTPAWIATPFGLLLLLLAFTQVHGQEAHSGADVFQRARTELEAGRAWEASRLFERAIGEGYPEASGYRALAEAYLSLDNRLFDAREALERSLAADSTDVATWYHLAEVNLRLGGMDAENRARRALRSVLRLDPRYRDAYDRWRSLYLDRRDHRRVASILATHLDRSYDPELALWRVDVLYEAGAYDEALGELERLERNALPEGEHAARWAHSMGVTLAALGRAEDGWRHYRRGVKTADDAADLQPYFVDLEPLLPEADRRAWADWSISAQRSYLEGWWNQRDPLPLSVANERWVEQQRRIRFVRETFQYRKPMDFERLTSFETADLVRPALEFHLDGRKMDDRAEIYLRHGAPDMKGGVGADECGFWYYRREGLPEDDSFAINFGRTFFGNDCVFRRLPTTDMGRGHFAPGGMEPWDRSRIIRETERELGLALASDSYPFEIAERVPLDAVPANFALRPGMTELSLYFSVPTDAVAAGSDTVRYRKGLVIYDGEWQEVARRSEEMQYVLGGAGGDAAPGVAFLIDLFRVRIRPGDYHFAIQVDDRRGKGIGVWKGPVQVRSFHPGRLELSDLVLAGTVLNEGQPRFERYGHVVLPLPSRTLLRGQPFFLYYEIDGLRPGPDGRSRFRVEYAIRSERLDRGAISRLFQGLAGLAGIREEPDAVVLAFDREQRVEGDVWPEVLSFDTRGLGPGTYRVEVTVIDRLAGDVRAEQAVEFTIED